MLRDLRLTFVFLVLSYVAWKAPHPQLPLLLVWFGSLPVGLVGGHWISKAPRTHMRYLRIYGAIVWISALVCAFTRDYYAIPPEKILPALLVAAGLYLPAYALGSRAFDQEVGDSKAGTNNAKDGGSSTMAIGGSKQAGTPKKKKKRKS